MTPHALRRAGALVAACAMASILGCATQKNAELNAEGMRLAESGQRVEGLALLAQASNAEPGNSRYRMDYLTQATLAVRDLLARGDKSFAAGDMDSARMHYADALNIHPGNDRARRGLAAVELDARHRVMIAEAEKLAAAGDLQGARAKLGQVLLENSSNAAAQRSLTKLNDRIERADEAARQKIAAASVLNRPVTLQFRDANLRMVFEAMSRTTGLNVIMDRDVRADLKTTIFVRDASVGDSVDMILLQNQLEKKVLNANTLFVYPATSAKQKEYQDLKVRTFQISNADAKYLQNVLKTVLKIKDIALDERTNTLVVRDTPDAIAVAEKVIAAHDNADAEVMLEVEVLEVSRDRLSNLGIKWPDSMTFATPVDANGQLTLGALRGLTSDQLLVTPLSLAINLKLQDTDASLLASPRIRVRQKEKARILIGDKVPVIINTVTPVASGAPVVTGSVQYLDVGIKLEAEPQVYAEGDVGIKLNLEVSNIVKEIQGPNGSLAYQIGSRSAQTNLRLRDGETQILGGLISDLDRNTAAKVPGLGDLPVVGRLFSSHAKNGNKSEIILSITPRIVRNATVANAGLRDVFAGTDSTMRQAPLRLDPVGAVRGESSGGATPAGPSPARPTLARPPASAEASGSPGATPPSSVVPPTQGGVPQPIVNRINRSRGATGTAPTTPQEPEASTPAAPEAAKPAAPEAAKPAAPEAAKPADPEPKKPVESGSSGPSVSEQQPVPLAPKAPDPKAPQ